MHGVWIANLHPDTWPAKYVEVQLSLLILQLNMILSPQSWSSYWLSFDSQDLKSSISLFLSREWFSHEDIHFNVNDYLTTKLQISNPHTSNLMLHNNDNKVRGTGQVVSKPAFLSASECNNNGIKILRHTYKCLQ